MSTVTLAEAESSPGELVKRLAIEGEILITDGHKPVATLTAPQTGGHSLLQFRPRSVGEVLRAVPHTDDDLLGEMLAGKLSPDK